MPEQPTIALREGRAIPQLGFGVFQIAPARIAKNAAVFELGVATSSTRSCAGKTGAAARLEAGDDHELATGGAAVLVPAFRAP
jgi:hypothetical protein